MKTFDVIVDYDDVIFGWSAKAHAVCERAGITNGKTITSWNIHECYGCTSEELWAVLGAATLTGELHQGPLIPGAAEELQRLMDYGNRVHIVTARGFGQHGDLIRELTVKQIEEHGVPHDSLHFAKDKGKVAIDLGASFAVDDGLHNYEALTEVGVTTFLMDQPHNKQARDVLRVHSMREVTDLITSVVWL